MKVSRLLQGTSKNYRFDEAAEQKPAHDHSFSHVHGTGAPVFRGALGILAVMLLLVTPLFSQEADLDDGLYAKMETSRGTIILFLDHEKAPLTVTNFVGLAEGTIDSSKDGAYYDNLTFHRVVEEFMVQTGDPTGSGSGGPGYTFPDEFHPDLRHTGPGILSMANRGPNTNGGQVFITHIATPWLDDRHAVFGHVVEGMDVVNAIEQGDKIFKVTILRIGSSAGAFKPTQRSFDNMRDDFDDRLGNLAERKRDEDIAAINARWPDADKTRSGIRFIVQESGSGRKKPKDGSKVTVHYTGSLLNDTVFDSSTDRGDPLEFEIGQVIEGWNQMLKDMKRGEKRLAIIPPELGYGEQGYPGIIPPNSFLVFEIELIDFE